MTPQEEADRAFAELTGAPVARKTDPAADAAYADLVGAPAAQPAQQGRGKGNPLTNFAQGHNSGVARLLGMPVDTVLNVADLATAGYGAIKGALGGKDLPELTDRKKYVGSSDWMLEKLRNVAPEIADPADPNSFWTAAGQGASSIYSMGLPGKPPMIPSTAAPTMGKIAANAGMGAASGIAAKYGGEAGGAPGAILAGMLPQLGLSGAQMALRGGFRGGNEGRQQMQDNLATLDQAGVKNPTVGLATGNGRTQWMESILSKLPISGNIMRDAGNQIQEQLQAKSNQLRDRTSNSYGPLQAGNAITKGIDAFDAAKQAKSSGLYDQLSGIPFYKTFGMPETQAMLKNATTPIVGAPGITKYLGIESGPFASMDAALRNDLMTNRYGQATAGVPFEAIKRLRSDIGANIPQQILQKDPLLGNYKSAYAATSKDLGAAANQAGLGPQFNRANDFSRGYHQRLEDLQPFYNKASPEQAYGAFKSAANGAGSISQTVMKSIPPEQRRVVAATVIDEMGTATAGRQNAEGTRFSADTFLTNWNRLDPKAKSTLFGGIGPDGASIRYGLDKVAKASDMLKAGSQVLANPSGTTPAAANIGGAAMAGGALASMNPLAIGTAGVALAVPAISAQMMTSKPFVNWLAQTTTIPTSRAQQHLSNLMIIAGRERDPKLRQDMLNYVAGFNEALGTATPEQRR